MTDEQEAQYAAERIARKRQMAITCNDLGPNGERCNRTKNHPPPHRVYNARDFSIKAQWEWNSLSHPSDRIVP